MDGFKEGTLVGNGVATDGKELGNGVGLPALYVGNGEGTADGRAVGNELGNDVGVPGVYVGEGEGAANGEADGDGLGNGLGPVVGQLVGLNPFRIPEITQMKLDFYSNHTQHLVTLVSMQ